MGRHARARARARAAARADRHGGRGFPGEHAAVGRGGQPPAHCPAARGAVRAGLPRARRHDGFASLHQGRGCVQPPLRLPARPVARAAAARLRPAAGGPDRLRHDDRAERVLRHGLAQGLGHHRPAAGDRDAHAAHLGPARRGHAAHRRGGPPSHRRLDLGAVRVLEPHAASRGAPAASSPRASASSPSSGSSDPYSQSASRCATSTAGRHVLARGTVGNTEQSATCSPSIPCTRRRSSTTGPIAQVPAGW